MLDLKVKMYELKTGHNVICYVDPHSLRRKRKKFSNIKEAKTYKKDLELQFTAKGTSSFNVTPVSQLMKYHLEKYPDSSVRERKRHFVSFCEEFGHRPINLIGKPELQLWFKKIKGEHDLSDRTLNTIKSCLNSFFKSLVDEEIITESPLSKIQFERKPPPRRQRVVLSIDEVHKILENAQNFSPGLLYPFLFATAYTGARRSEILKLKKSDVDLEMGLLHFRGTKNGEDRTIRLPKSLKSFLETHLNNHSAEFVFPDPNGKAIGRQRLQRLLRRFKKHFPIGKDWGPHALRHSFAYNYLKKGGEMYQLQAILGHKSIDVTVDVYGQIGAQDVENACPYEN
ncbi:MAG: site-specific integrase [Bdellovibrionales bacterium]|nr:site-specific integrase [Bdellovibrionales bacterium]